MKKFKYLIMSILMSSMFIVSVQAASINVSCPSTAYVGDTIKCTVNANNNDGLGGGIEGTISYTGVTFNSVSNISGSNYFTPTESEMKGAFDMTDASSKSLAEYSFIANNEGTAKVVVDCNKLSSYTFETLTCTGNTATITISKKQTPTPTPENKEDEKKKKENNTKVTEVEKSSDSELKELSVKGYSVIKGEDNTYTLMVDSDIEEITISATAKDEKATVNGAGIKKIVDGDNKFEIIVTAEDGTTKTYTLVVTREKKADTNIIEKETTDIEEKVVEETNKNHTMLYVFCILGVIALIFIIFLVIKSKKEDN